MGNTSSGVKRKYNEKTYDRATCFLKKGQLQFLKSIAAEHNVSLNSLIITAITNHLANEYSIDFNDFPKAELKEE